MNELIASALKFSKEGTQQFLNTFKCVPEDKLTWSPSPTAKNAIQIAAHTAVANFGLGAGIRSGKSEFNSLEEYEAFVKKEEAKIQTRDRATKAIQDSLNELEKILTNLNPAQLAQNVITPFGSVPMNEMIFWPGNHCFMHSAQIDYLQTILGDTDMHF